MEYGTVQESVRGKFIIFHLQEEKIFHLQEGKIYFSPPRGENLFYAFLYGLISQHEHPSSSTPGQTIAMTETATQGAATPVETGTTTPPGEGGGTPLTGPRPPVRTGTGRGGASAGREEGTGQFGSQA